MRKIGFPPLNIMSASWFARSIVRSPSVNASPTETELELVMHTRIRSFWVVSPFSAPANSDQEHLPGANLFLRSVRLSRPLSPCLPTLSLTLRPSRRKLLMSKQGSLLAGTRKSTKKMARLRLSLVTPPRPLVCSSFASLSPPTGSRYAIIKV